MNKRLLKRHKRQVSRARGRIRLSEPDVRTPEQVRAAREASRPAADRRRGAHASYATRPPQGQAEIAVKAAPQPDGATDRDGKGTGSPRGPFERGKEVL